MADPSGTSLKSSTALFDPCESPREDMVAALWEAPTEGLKRQGYRVSSGIHIARPQLLYWSHLNPQSRRVSGRISVD
jgi:hypothetical protein